ncbi:MAG TPA: hypothetical protein VJ755_09250, partial [Gemmatimonadales bacterium]|nr:hypothetical protein [Gemmatimonadales bacterium]
MPLTITVSRWAAVPVFGLVAALFVACEMPRGTPAEPTPPPPPPPSLPPPPPPPGTGVVFVGAGDIESEERRRV